MKNLVIYTDGSYSSARDQGGVGIVLVENNKKIFEYSNMYKRTTNNQMELGAIIIALRLIKTKFDKIVVYTDSQYCVGCITEGWQRKKNKRLWNEFDNQLKRVKELCSDITFKHVKGHQSGLNLTEDAKWNNYVDNIAQKASIWI